MQVRVGDTDVIGEEHNTRGAIFRAMHQCCIKFHIPQALRPPLFSATTRCVERDRTILHRLTNTSELKV